VSPYPIFLLHTRLSQLEHISDLLMRQALIVVHHYNLQFQFDIFIFTPPFG